MMAAVAHVSRACLLCWLRTLTPVQGFKNDTCGCYLCLSIVPILQLVWHV